MCTIFFFLFFFLPHRSLFSCTLALIFLFLGCYTMCHYFHLPSLLSFLRSFSFIPYIINPCIVSFSFISFHCLTTYIHTTHTYNTYIHSFSS
ncbi:hypothetical protein BJ165DRAFT_1374563 [Panaeolus papilionaceus]|nr:hypothetical protein BJ165DRAFT_1374563 [Panaeolus papilionaceus]